METGQWRNTLFSLFFFSLDILLSTVLLSAHSLCNLNDKYGHESFGVVYGWTILC